MSELNKYETEKLDDHVKRLKLEVATANLLANIMPENHWPVEKVRRYGFLASKIEKYPALLHNLNKNNRHFILKQWTKVVSKNKSDTQFLHGLAVLYREQAIALEGNGEKGERYWTLSTCLWSLLFSSKEFWNYFSKNCRFNISIKIN